MNRIMSALQSPAMQYMRVPLPARLSLLLHTAVAVLVVFLTFYNLDRFPTISGWDEGIFLQFAENHASYGEFATRNGTTLEQLNPTLSVGPTLIVPVSMMLSFAGNNLLAARLVVAVYLLFAAAGVYFLMRMLFDERAGLLALLFFAFAGLVGFNTLALGRQVVGEAPMLAFFIWGLWAWIKSWQQKNDWRMLIISASLFALAVITKGQLVALLAAVFTAVTVLDLIYYRCLSWPARLIPLLGAVSGYVLWWVILTPLLADEPHRSIFLTNQSEMTRAFLTISPLRMRMNLGIIYQSGQWWLFAAVPYVLWLSRSRSLEGLRHSLLPIATVIALAVYVSIHAPWARYTQMPLMLAGFCAAAAITDIIWRMGTRFAWRPGTTIAVWIATILIAVGPYLVPHVHLTIHTNDTSAQEFAAVIEAHVPSDEHIVSWEWEIDFFSERAFIRPSYALFPAMFDAAYNLRYPPILEEPRIPDGVRYFIVGPASSDFRLFNTDIETRPHTVVAQAGDYILYRLD